LATWVGCLEVWGVAILGQETLDAAQNDAQLVVPLGFQKISCFPMDFSGSLPQNGCLNITDFFLVSFVLFKHDR